MARYSSFICCRQREGGVALLTAMLLMLAVLMTSVAAARTAVSGARMAGHERDRMLALQGAMAALADAEHDIEGGANPASARAAALASADPAAFAGGCGGGTPYEGLCSHGAGEVLAALASPEGPGVALGSFTGAHMPSGEGALAAQAPRYLVERMPAPSGAMLYRITALGFGSAETTQVAVQAYYRKLLPPGPAAVPAPPEAPGAPGEAAPPDPPGSAPPDTPRAPGTPGGPGVRVGWREIGNWHDAVATGASS